MLDTWSSCLGHTLCQSHRVPMPPHAGLTCCAKLLVEAILQMKLRGPGLDGLLQDRGLLPRPSFWAWGARPSRAGQGRVHSPA